MNILMFNYEYPPLGGGGGVVHELIAQELAARHRVVVITSGGLGLPRHETRDGVEIHRVRVFGRAEEATASLRSMLSYPVGAWWRAAAVLKRERFDLINGHFAVPTGPGSLPTAKLARIPHVLSLHGGDLYDPSKRISPHRLPLVRPVVRAVLRYSDAVVAQSSNTLENTRRYYGFSGPIQIIPLGIRVPSYSVVSRAQLGLPEDVFLAVTVGRLVKRKAIDRLVRILARPSCSRVHLVVIGDGPEEAELRAEAARAGVEQRVRFTGRVEEERKWQLLRCADAYVSATLHEGFGLVFLEAMAAGLPVLTPDHGGQTDFLENGVTGYLVPAADDEALARGIARLQADPATSRRMGAENQQRFQNFRIEKCASAYEKLFRRVIEKKGAPAVGMAG